MPILRLGSYGFYFDSKLQNPRTRLSSNIQSNTERALLLFPSNLWTYIGGGGISECCIAGNFSPLSFMKAKSCFSQSPTKKRKRGVHVDSCGTFDICKVGTTENR